MLVAQPGLGEGFGELADGRAGHLRQVRHHLEQRIAQAPPARPTGRRRRHVQQVACAHCRVSQLTVSPTRGAKRNKLSNVWVFVQLIFCPAWSTISCKKHQNFAFCTPYERRGQRTILPSQKSKLFPHFEPKGSSSECQIVGHFFRLARSVLLVAQFVGDCGRRRKRPKEGRKAAGRERVQGRGTGGRPPETDGERERESRAAVWQERAPQCYGLVHACKQTSFF